MTNPIRMVYFNVEGLSADKHRICCSLIDAGIFGILFLSDTCFTNKSSYMSHPYSFLQTTPSASKNSRGHAGILLMLNTRARKLVPQYRVLHKAIWINFSGRLSVLAVYLPPSMSQPDLQSCLDSFLVCHILLGDINVRFTGITKKAPSKSTLWDLWRNYMVHRNLSLVMPSRTGPQLPPLLPIRHLFTNSQSLQTRSFSAPSFDLTLLDAEQFQLKSAHKYILLCSIPIQRQEDATLESISRFHIEKLDQKDIRERILQVWSSVDENVEWNVDDVNQDDSRLLHALTTTAKSVLGTYDVLTRKRAPDNVASKLIHSLTSSLAAIRLFKRKQRINSSTLALQSCPSDRTPFDECVEIYRPSIVF